MLRVLPLLAVLSCAKPTNPSPSKPAFDAETSSEEFVTLVREAYAYLDRDDFDVQAQLEHTRKRAAQATDLDAFRQEIHRSTFAFTDPHFIIGPFTDDDPNIIRTPSPPCSARRPFPGGSSST